MIMQVATYALFEERKVKLHQKFFRISLTEA